MIPKLITALSASVVFGTLFASLQASADNQVVVPRSSTVQIAVVLPPDDFGQGAWNAVQLAVEKHAQIRGFDIQLNRFTTPCQGPGNTAAATEIVANPQNVAVIGHFCSGGFAAALPIYEAAGIVTVSGSATSPFLPAFGPHVFNDVAVSDACCPPQDRFGPWYSTVMQLPKDVFWHQHTYAKEFGTSPTPFADLYYDAASLLLDKIAATARPDSRGTLVIDRAALAQAVRSTAGFDGVTCDVTLGADGYRVNDPRSLAKCASTG